MYGFARKALFAALLAGVAGPALAADYIEEPIEVVPVIGGWYIRGYIGMSNQFFDGLESDLFDIPVAHRLATTKAASPPHRSSAAVSATSSTTICAATSRSNGAASPISTRSTGFR